MSDFHVKYSLLPMGKTLALPLCHRRGGKSFGALLVALSVPHQGTSLAHAGSCCVLLCNPSRYNHGSQTPSILSAYQMSCCGYTVRLQAGLNVDSTSLQMHRGNKAPEGYKLAKPKLHFSEVKKQETKEPRWKNAGFLLKSKGILALTSIGNVPVCSEI